MQDSYPGIEQRKFIRLNSIFPVQFRYLSLDGKRFLSDWLQGFTSNICRGGICLKVYNLNPDLAVLLRERQVKLLLDIDVPFTGGPIPAQSKVVWMKDILNEPNQYLIGLGYEEIDPQHNNRLMRCVWAKKILFPLVTSLIVLLTVAFMIDSIINAKLISGNKVLIEQLVKIMQESSIAKQKVKDISREREDLQLKIQAMQSRIQSVEEEKGKSESAKADEVSRLNNMVVTLTHEKDSLQEQLNSLQHTESAITEDLLRLDKRKFRLEKANLDRMYQWLKIHQNRRTGLVMSFEGDSDINDWAFTYDQSLLIQANSYFANFSRAEKTLEFFFKKAKRLDGFFFNAYSVADGSPQEYVVHSGPNIWLGIAAVQYTKKSQDKKYLSLAEEIAGGIIYLQSQDKDGGIRGGPNTEWYSTEHNLDAYAFFNMLYQITGKDMYLQARDKVLNWLMQHTYDKVETPIKRGKGDSTIATDTYAWSIAAIGPEKLSQLGMNPDGIIEFAEENCAVSVDYMRPEGKSVKVKGFDFAAKRHTARGGVVSSEWTAQMIMAYKIMSDFYYKKSMPAKARAYEGKADAYMAELSNMIISSPSPSGQGESCLPYASEDFVDTGHGWMTPKGKSTGSVAGTAYTLFAYYEYNPLELKE